MSVDNFIASKCEDTAVKGLYFFPAEHKYFHKSGPKGYRGILREVPGITSILQRAGLSQIEHVPAEALARGTAVHKACEAWLADFGNSKCFERVEISDELMLYLKCFDQFLKDMKWRPLHSERVVFSKQHWYAGRVDAIFELPSQKKRKKNVLVETKTNTMPECVFVQIAAQRWACNECKIPIHEAGCLVLKPNAYSWKEQKRPLEDWQEFRQALEFNKLNHVDQRLEAERHIGMVE